MGRIPLGFIAFPFAAIAKMKAKKAPSLFIAGRERRTTLYSFKRATTARPRSDSSSRRYSTGKH